MSQFDSRQQEQVKIGLEQGLDVSVYARSEFDWRQMEQIRLGLERGLDVSIYAKPEFSDRQMYYIRSGLVQKIDVSWYAKPEFDSEQMKQIKLGLEKIFESSKTVDVSWYAKPEFDWRQMSQVRVGLKQGLDVSWYAKPEFKRDQMEQIRLGLEKMIDVSSYANPELDYEQMREKRLEIERILRTTKAGGLELKDVAKLLKKDIMDKYPDVKISVRTRRTCCNRIYVRLFFKEHDYRAFTYYELAESMKQSLIDTLNIDCADDNLDIISNYLSGMGILNKKGHSVFNSIHDFLDRFNYDKDDPQRKYFGFESRINFEFV
ncbi:hypothetical protein ABDJ34_08350 [Finegoldia dalianensis]|uniref:Uncharacterized protein n=1 Tax=Finegoldia dalianensis TaxID=3145239 RepID=A0ABW9KFD9_9FIRM